MSSLNDLCGCFQNWAGLSDTDMAAYVRRLNSLGLISGGGGAKGPAPIIVDDAIWMLLIVLAGGDVKRAQDIAELVNSQQTVADAKVSDGDPAITLFDGLRDIINLRRAGLLIVGGDFRLLEDGERVSAVISAEIVLEAPLFAFPAGSRVVGNFAFGPQPGTADDGPRLWQFTVATMSLIDELANLLGPLPVTSMGLGTGISAAAVPIDVADETASRGTLH
jgi:hypothetical protein